MSTGQGPNIAIFYLFVNKKCHIFCYSFIFMKKQVTVTIGSVHQPLYIMSPTNNMKNMHVNDFRKKLRQPHTFNHF